MKSISAGVSTRRPKASEVVTLSCPCASRAVVAPDVHREVELAQRRLAALVIERAGLGHRDAARVAVEQAAVQRLLDSGDVLGHARLRHRQIVGRAGETAGLDDPHDKRACP